MTQNSKYLQSYREMSYWSYIENSIPNKYIMHKIIKNWEKFILKLCKRAYESQMSFKFILGSYPEDIADVYTNNQKSERREHGTCQVSIGDIFESLSKSCLFTWK